MKSFLPIILVILVLTAAITFSLAKRSVPKREANTFGIAANLLETNSIDSGTGTKKTNFGFGETLTPSPTPTSTPTPTPDNKITPLPTVSEDKEDKTASTTKGGQTVSSAKPTPKISRELVCTPVYGSANTCVEHIVVDTGASDSVFFNIAGISYLAGLVSFIRAKYLRA